jgi:hypothetical protein
MKTGLALSDSRLTFVLRSRPRSRMAGRQRKLGTRC